MFDVLVRSIFSQDPAHDSNVIDAATASVGACDLQRECVINGKPIELFLEQSLCHNTPKEISDNGFDGDRILKLCFYSSPNADPPLLGAQGWPQPDRFYLP